MRPHRVRPHVLDNPSLPGDAADDPGRAMAVQPPSVRRKEDGACYSLADGQIDCPGGARCQRYCDDLAALAGDHQRPVPALDGQGVDIGTNGFGYPQPVQG
jgi:hypothetical protein